MPPGDLLGLLSGSFDLDCHTAEPARAVSVTTLPLGPAASRRALTARRIRLPDVATIRTDVTDATAVIDYVGGPP